MNTMKQAEERCEIQAARQLWDLMSKTAELSLVHEETLEWLREHVPHSGLTKWAEEFAVRLFRYTNFAASFFRDDGERFAQLLGELWEPEEGKANAFGAWQRDWAWTWTWPEVTQHAGVVRHRDEQEEQVEMRAETGAGGGCVGDSVSA